MPKFFAIIIRKIMDFFCPVRVTFRREEEIRAKARAARKEQFEEERQFLFKVRERQLKQPKKEEAINEDELQKQITSEQGWAEKGVQYFCTLKMPSFPEKVFGMERFYQVEVVLPKKEALAYAYVECREAEGATVFLCYPTMKDEKVYKALSFYQDETIELTYPETISMVKRIFNPLFESKAA